MKTSNYRNKIPWHCPFTVLCLTSSLSRDKYYKQFSVESKEPSASFRNVTEKRIAQNMAQRKTDHRAYGVPACWVTRSFCGVTHLCLILDFL